MLKRKYSAIIYLLILTIGTIASLYIPKTEAAKTSDEVMVIPDEAIRLRILANSDHEEDQAVKRLIRDRVNESITEWVAELTSIEEARNVIRGNLDEVEQIAKEVMEEEGLKQTVSVKFGQADFPTKLYGQYLYPAGDYEAVIITLGAGEGANWWCVLFPPLCFLDFSNGTAVSQSPVEDQGSAEETVSKEKTSVPVQERAENVPVTQEETEEQAAVKADEPKQTGEEKQEKQEKEERSDLQQPVQEKSEPEQSAGDVDKPAKNRTTVYNGEEPQEIEVKSFFGELFTNLF
ncbi:stage II sporulation protein R [Bacillus massiliglaciei]|uniref:stage II sporulation protein R n=1 Tax=Bacillus massiliglaciei TaxID=1816693 RepID=UPI000AF113A0|nr:stage II sporulation protein R [Bacillus massiliglaciei]